MEIKIKRFFQGRNYIIGRLSVNGTYLCDTLEPPLGLPAGAGIPPGRYRLQSYPSAKFHGIRPLVADVPGRYAILIHEGNTVADTKGCILVGRNTKVAHVLQSKIHLNKLLSVLRPAWKSGEDVWLIYD